jgi:hypothetical protein
MITLMYFSSGSFMQVIGDTLGYDKSTLSRVVEDVIDAGADPGGGRPL